jgi:tetratricopeptide (TPR) repeat protein
LKGNMQDALKAYQKLIELEPQADQGQYYLGIVQKAMNQFDHAVQAFTQAIQRNDQEAIYYFSRGEAYYNMGEFLKAKTDFEEGLSLAPEFNKNQAIHSFLQNIKQKLSESKHHEK